MNRLKSIILFLLLTSALSGAFAQENTPKPQTSHPADKFSPDNEQMYLSKLPEKTRQALGGIKNFHKDKYYELLHLAYFESLEISELLESGNKELAGMYRRILDLEAISRTAGIRYEYAGSEEKTQIKAELMPVLEELFEIREKARKKEIERLEKELAELKKALKVRRANKTKIVQSRFGELLGENKYLEWE